ncbi:MAG: CDC27 family protein [Bacillota bacterium]|nr:CDC27 family protein [Bacillota bacterium]
MDYWSILNINPTEDVSIIKKAYANKLKHHHPEIDPHGYQRLREAYDAALKYTKRMAKSNNKQSCEIRSSEKTESRDRSTPPNEDLPNEEETEDKDNINSLIHMKLLGNQLQSIPSIEAQNAEFMMKVEALYNDFFSRINIENWKPLLNSHIIWDISNKRTISKLMLDFLSSHRYLPQDIWMLLDDNFNWRNMANTIHHSYYDEFIMYIQKQIDQLKPSNYSFFKRLEGVDYEKFLEYRENAQISFGENNLSAASLYIERAKKIYTDDPDLLRIEGQIYMRNGNIDYAILIFNKLLSINPNDSDAISYRATAFYEKKQIQECLSDYSRVYSKVPDTKEIPLLMAKSYFKIGSLEKANEWALKALKIKISHNEARSLLSQVYVKLRKTLTEELERDPSNKELKLRLDAVNSEMFKSVKKSGAKINSEKIFALFKIISKIILYTLLILLCLAVALATKIGLLIFIFFFVRRLINKKK